MLELPESTDVPVAPKSLEPVTPVVRLDVPMPVPAQGVEVLLGPGTMMPGLTPALPISVAPRGIVPPFSTDVFAAGFDSGDANPPVVPMPDDEPAPDVETQEVAWVMPPPSKLELELEPELELMLDVRDPAELPIPTQLVVGVEPICSGLRPPGSISVAPSGIPAGDA